MFPFCSNGRNPGASTRTVYAPGTTAPKKKSPDSFVSAVCDSPLSSEVTFTVALGTTCPLGSATVPAIEPVEPCCANALTVSKSVSPAVRKKFLRICYPSPTQQYWFLREPWLSDLIENHARQTKAVASTRRWRIRQDFIATF